MNNVVYVQNLKCQGCEAMITSALEKIEGISSVTVDHTTGEVAFLGRDSKAESLVISKLNKLGYPKVGQNNSILKKGISFTSCMIGKTKTQQNDLQ